MRWRDGFYIDSIRDSPYRMEKARMLLFVYYWLIRSYQKQHMDEMAAGELAAAKQKLPEDEYQKLLNSLER